MTNCRSICALAVCLVATSLSGCVYFQKQQTPSVHNLNVVLPKALEGNTNAQQLLGSAFSLGWGGVDIDTMAGLRHLHKAAEADEAYAQLVLGNFYLNHSDTRNKSPDGVSLSEDDLPKAAYWLHRAAVQHVPDAYNKLRQLYGTPSFAGADPIEACKWALIAAPQSPGCAFDDARRRAADWQTAHPVKKP